MNSGQNETQTRASANTDPEIMAWDYVLAHLDGLLAEARGCRAKREYHIEIERATK